MGDGLDGLSLPDGLGVRWAIKTGSRWTCRPPVLGTDDDRLLLVEDLDVAVERLKAAGWQGGGSRPEGDTWASMRLESVNLILTDNAAFAVRFGTATRWARQLNLLTRESRVALFKAVLYGK